MRILVAPDDFTGTMTALEAAEAIAAGWRRRRPDDDIVLRPMSDGGPGFLSVIAQARADAQFCPLVVRGPLGDPVPAGFLVVSGPDSGDVTGYIESATACGLALVADRQPLRATTYGVGELMKGAVAAGATRLVLGLGGSATTDGGAGMLAALGARAFDDNGIPLRLDAGGGDLGRVARVDLAPAREAMSGVEVVLASDVDSPLHGPRGSARGFAPQKGAGEAEVEILEAALATYAAAIGRRADGKDPAVALGAGAAGGLGYGLLCLGSGPVRLPGIRTVAEIVALDEGIASADLVITGEGCFDWQSLRGKVVSGVAAAALAQARPVVVLAGRVEVGRRDYAAIGVTAAYAVEPAESSPGEPAKPGGLADGTAGQGGPREGLARAAERAARQWGRS